ncbi:sialoadhesin-like isoform X1 [Mizuhopecten yessoensis]|uniref:sialoadhesin-like isoform X1 n=1 Tax=Mizuhopecten yessoensis TaxID=6573 RepID=UPI000B45B34A|nr:sialoadhesin-like isoform X1 [Mizuhopecten yessoensis]
MAYTLPGVVVLLQLLTVNLAKGANVNITPTPVATVTDGDVLWLTCTYDLGGGTLGQLQWKGNDGGIVATVTPTAGTPCTISVSGYNIDCDNLTSSEVRLGIFNPVHGDTYSCFIYLFDSTQIGPASTQVSVITQTLTLSVMPSSPILEHELTFTCSVGMDIIENTQIFYKRNTFLVGTFLVNSTSCVSTKTQGGQNYTFTCGLFPVRELLLTIPAAHVTGDEQGTDWICNIFLSGVISNIVHLELSVPVTSVEIQPPAGQSLNITENQSIEVICVTSACRPFASVFWSVGGVNVTFAGASSVQSVPGDLYITTSTLTLTPSRALSGQTVVCTASNTETQIQSTRQPTLNVRHLPEILILPTSDPYVIPEGQKNITLMCTVTSANPNVSSLVWTREATELSNNGVYNLPVITTGDAGAYSCSAVNDVGTTSLNITLKVTTLPTTPNIVGLTEVTSSTLTVKWTPNDKGDMANAFNISHECKDCAEAESTSVNLADRGNIYSSKLTNLFPGSEYYVNITAINMAGSSSPLELIVSTSPADTCPSPLEDTSTTSTALLVVGVILVLIAVAVLGISVFVYRKSRLLSKSGNRKGNDQKPFKFSNVQQSKEGKQQEIVEERGHYQELYPNDIQKPSPYSCLSEDNNEAGIETVRGNYESIHGDSTARHDYIEIKEVVDTRRYANT